MTSFFNFREERASGFGVSTFAVVSWFHDLGPSLMLAPRGQHHEHHRVSTSPLCKQGFPQFSFVSNATWAWGQRMSTCIQRGSAEEEECCWRRDPTHQGV